MTIDHSILLSGRGPDFSNLSRGITDWQTIEANKQQLAMGEAQAAAAKRQKEMQGLTAITNSLAYLDTMPEAQRPAAFERIKAFAKTAFDDPNGYIDQLTIDMLPQVRAAITPYAEQLKANLDIGEFGLKQEKNAADIANVNNTMWNRDRATGSGMAVDQAQIGGIANANRNRDAATALDYETAARTGYGQAPEGYIIGGDGRATSIPGVIPKDAVPDGAGGFKPAPNFEGETKLRGEYTKQTDEFATIGNAYRNVVAAASNPSAASDMSLIFGFMKMLDPGSVVREGEFANAQNAAGVPDQILNLYNRVRTGERLNDAQRADFVNNAKSLYDGASSRAQKVGETYTGLATQYGFEPGRVVYDRSAQIPEGLPSPADLGASEGDEVTGPDGRTYTVQGGKLVPVR